MPSKVDETTRWHCQKCFEKFHPSLLFYAGRFHEYFKQCLEREIENYGVLSDEGNRNCDAVKQEVTDSTHLDSGY